jgi:hypothetical protein
VTATTTFAYVRPGDLITAEYFNGLIDAINALALEIDAHELVAAPGELRLTVTPGAQPVAGGPYSFLLTLDGAKLGRAQDFELDGVYSAVVGGEASDWQHAVLSAKLPGSSTATPLSVVHVTLETAVTFRVALTVPALAKSVAMAIRARSLTDSSANTESGPFPIVVVQEEAGALQPQITRILPIEGVRAGGAITIEGENFASVLGQNVVTLDSDEADPPILTLAPGGSTTSLSTSMPMGLRDLPRTVPVRLTTPGGVADGFIPVVVETDRTAVLFDVTGEDLQLVLAAGPHERRVELETTGFDPGESFEISVTYRDPGGAPNDRWTTIFPDLGPARVARLGAGGVTTFGLRIIVPAEPSTVAMTVTARAAGDLASSASVDIAIPVEPPPAGPLTIGRHSWPDIQSEVVEGFPTGGLAVRYGTFPTVTLVALFDEDAPYTFTAPPQAPTGHWVIEELPSAIAIMANVPTAVHIRLGHVPGSSPGGPSEFLEVIARRALPPGGEEYRLRFPIRGFS